MFPWEFSTSLWFFEPSALPWLVPLVMLALVMIVGLIIKRAVYRGEV